MASTRSCATTKRDYSCRHRTAKPSLAECSNSSATRSAHVASPIAGDTLYGANAVPDHDGFYLHAASITFPLGGERVHIDVPAPARFTAALAACGL